MNREEILAQIRKQRSEAGVTGASGPVTADDVRARVKQQREAAGVATVPSDSPTPTQPKAPEESSALSRGLKRGVVGAMGPLGNVANLLGLTDEAFGGLEAGASIAGGAAVGIPASIAGYRDVYEQYSQQAEGTATGGAEAAGDVYRGSDFIQGLESMVYQPKTAEGRQALEGFTDVLSPVGEAFTEVSEFLGDTAYDVLGSPTIATVFYAAPDVALELTGLGTASRTVRASKLARQSKEVKAATELLENAEIRVADPVGAQWKLDKDGVAVPNEMGRELVKSKVVSGSDAALITNSNKITRKQMTAMTEAFNRRAEGNPQGLSPSEIIGANGGKALSEANKARKSVGAEMDAMVKGPVGETLVDIRPVVDGFYTQLSELGIKPTVNMNTGKVELDFRGSSLDLKNLAGARSLMADAFEISTTRGRTTLADVHKMKKQLDDLLDAKKLEQGGTLGNMERKLLTLRSGLNNTAKGVKGYGELNAKYSDILDAMRPFDTHRPAGMSWDDPDVASNIGAALKSASADTANVNKMLRGLTNLNTAMKNAGAKPFSVDVAGLARYSDFLNTNWSRTVAESQPKGGFLRGARQNIQGAALSGMVGNKFGVANNISGLVASGMDAKIASQVAKKAKENQRLVLRALSQ